MHNVPFYVLCNPQRTGVDLTLVGKRGSVVAVATFTESEARELQRQLDAALEQLRPAVRS